MQTEQTNLLKNDSAIIPNDYFNKAIFRLGCIGGLGCTVVQALSIGDIISTKVSSWISLAGVVSLFGVSIYGLACSFNSKSDVISKPLDNVDFTKESISENTSEIKDILKKVNEIYVYILGDKATQNDTDANKFLFQLELIHNFLFDKETQIKNLQESKNDSIVEKKSDIEKFSQYIVSTASEKKELMDKLEKVNAECESLVLTVQHLQESLVEKESDTEKVPQFINSNDSEQKNLETELNEVKQECEYLEAEVESLQTSLKIFGGHISTINRLLGNEGAEFNSETIRKVRMFIATLMKDPDSDSSATNSPNKTFRRRGTVDSPVPKFNINLNINEEDKK